MSTNDEAVLKSHRREVAVLFCDLRGFTAFAEAAEPEEVTGVLRDFHDSVGRLINTFGATVGYLAGDGLMVFFNDPLPCDNPALSAVTLAVGLRDDMAEVAGRWSRLGHELGFGVGVAFGYATLGEVGFQGRYEYAVIGSVTNLAARLCAEAKSGEILIGARVQAAVGETVEVERFPDVTLKGFHKPVPVYNVISLNQAASLSTSESDVNARSTPMG